MSPKNTVAGFTAKIAAEVAPYAYGVPQTITLSATTTAGEPEKILVRRVKMACRNRFRARCCENAKGLLGLKF